MIEYHNRGNDCCIAYMCLVGNKLADNWYEADWSDYKTKQILLHFGINSHFGRDVNHIITS